MKAILFDLFGTLVHIPQSRSPYREFVRAASVANARDLVLTSDSSPGRMARQLGLNPEAPAVLNIIELINHDVENIVVYPETLATLSRLKEAGYALIVVSNLAKPYGRAKALLGDLIDYWNFSFETGIAKPDARMFTLPAAAFGVKPENCVVVGDSITSDQAGAAAAGMGFILLDRDGKHGASGAAQDLIEVTERILHRQLLAA